MGTVSPTPAPVQPAALDRVAAHLCVQGYRAPEYALDRLASGYRPAELVEIGLLEADDRAEVERLLAAWDDAHDVEMAILDEMRSGPDDEPYVPSEADETFYNARLASRDGDDWPRLKTDADRRNDQVEIMDWFRDHPQG